MSEAEKTIQQPDKADIPTVILLSDEPSSSDEFDAKAHDRVARAIAELVRSEADGRVIGLEGSWGSGKSTVVRLVSSYLRNSQSGEKPPNRHVVTFDAWAHQGDPLRRTFLESLINELATVKWLSGRTSQELRDKLVGKKARVRTTSTQRLTWEGMVAAAAAILVPLGIFLAANHFSTLHRLALFVGIILATAPLVVVALLAIAHYVGVLLGGQGEHSTGFREWLARVDAFSFFAKEQVTESSSEQMERGDPTSVEFEQFFSETLEHAIKYDRRLLIVLDNLDRVEEKEAKTILATMQTFTGSRPRGSSDWFASVWTLVPYDPSGLDRLWEPTLDYGDEPLGQDGSDASPSVEHGARTLATSTAATFIEKVFQVRFETPPLVLSEWRGHVDRLLKQALPGVDDDDIGPVLRLRGLYPACEPERVVASEAPTPRQLKQFVNQIGAICRQRDDLPLVHIAYYVLLRRDGIDIPRGLVSGALPHQKLAHIFDVDVGEDLAALHFGTQRALAQQLLLRGALESAIAKRDSETLAQLTARSGFLDVLETLDLDSGNGGVEFTRLVAVLQAAKAFDIRGIDEWSGRVLQRRARAVQQWALDGKETGFGLAILFDKMSSGNDDDLLELLRRIVPDARETDTEGRLQLEGLAELADELVRSGRSHASPRVRINIPAERLAVSIVYFGNQIEHDESRRVLELAADAWQVAAIFVDQITGDTFRPVQPALETLVSGQRDAVDLHSLAGGCLTWLAEHDPSSQEHFAALLGVVDTARQRISLDDPLGTAADTGTLMHLVGLALASGWVGEAASPSMLHLLVRPEFQNPQASRQSTAGTQRLRQALSNPGAEPEFVSFQLEWLKQHQEEAFPLLMKVLGDGAFRPWVDGQVRELHAASALTTSADDYLAHWQYLQEVLGPEGFSNYTRGLADEPDARIGIIDKTQDPALVRAVLDAALDGAEADYTPQLLEWAANIIRSEASAAKWKGELESDDAGPLVQISLRLAGTSTAPSDPPGLDNALRDHFRALADGQSAWQPEAEVFAKLTKLLLPQTRATLASEVCANLEGRGGKFGIGLLRTHRIFLAGEKDFRTHSKLPNVVERLVAYDNWEALGYFVDLAQQHRDTFQKTRRKAEIGHLSRKVSEKLDELGDGAPEALRRLATFF